MIHLLGSVIGKPDSLPENSDIAKLKVNLFDSAVGSTGKDEKIATDKNWVRCLRIKHWNCTNSWKSD